MNHQPRATAKPKGSGRTFGELNQKVHEMFSFGLRHSQGKAPEAG
jgi:hypothetical protein